MDAPLATRIDTIFVPARDTEGAAAWYARLFGMTEIFRSAGYIGLRFAGGDPKSTALTLIPAERVDPDAHVAFNFFSPDPEALREALIADGREVTEIHDQGAMRWFDFVDPAGNRVNVCSFAEDA
ncbi:VOC family protein [Pelagibacterium halotolerans]|uniref:VOC family protein n=1 Tax=Pelagibacterium halotolerans TaxID=531813 RepID=UPI00384C341B